MQLSMIARVGYTAWQGEQNAPKHGFVTVPISSNVRATVRATGRLGEERQRMESEGGFILPNFGTFNQRMSTA